MRDRERWHLSEEAVYDYLDRTLSPAAMAEAERHLRSCPQCAGRLRRAMVLFRRIESTAALALETDLSAGVVASLQAARASRRRWTWIMLAEAAAAAVALAALSIRFEGWIDLLLRHPGFQSVREQGLRLAAQAAAWLAPFFELIPAYSSRIAAWRITVPHLEGPVLWWAGLAVAAVALGLVGNTLLLRSANGYPGKAPGAAEVRETRSGPQARTPVGRRK